MYVHTLDTLYIHAAQCLFQHWFDLALSGAALPALIMHVGVSHGQLPLLHTGLKTDVITYIGLSRHYGQDVNHLSYSLQAVFYAILLQSLFPTPLSSLCSTLGTAICI
jgi:hypothetical protein